MKPEVVVAILVVNLLPLQSLALLADTEATGSETNSRGRAAAADARMKNLHPVGTRFEARRKRSLPDDVDYRGPEEDGGRLLPELLGPDVGGDSGWGDGDARRRPVVRRRHPAHSDWAPAASEMAWIRRRSPERSSTAPRRDRRLGGWTDAGMEWIKRRGDAGRWPPPSPPDKRRWEKSCLSWMKRQGQTATSISNRDDGEQRGAADNWENGFADIDWIKRRHGIYAPH